MTVANLLSFVALMAMMSALLVELAAVNPDSTSDVLLVVVAVSSITATLSSFATYLLCRVYFREFAHTVTSLQRTKAEEEGIPPLSQGEA